LHEGATTPTTRVVRSTAMTTCNTAPAGSRAAPNPPPLHVVLLKLWSIQSSRK
jgi:hypothetical protein